MTAWASGAAYDPFLGRWSRLVAAEFVRWLDVAPGARWVDVGCGTGALTETILRDAAPASVLGVEPSEAFAAHARAAVPAARVVRGSATALPLRDGAADLVVSGLVLNFVPDPAKAVAEARRVGRTVAAYVWDYGAMEMLGHFWAAAGDLGHDETARSPMVHPVTLGELTGGEPYAIDVTLRYADFDDYWTPFLGGTGPAPAYLATLDDDAREALRERVRARLPVAADGSIPLTARAWAVRA